MFKVCPKIKTNWIYFITAFLAVIATDQISKYYILQYFPTKVFKNFGLFGHFGLYWEGFFVVLVLIFFFIFRRIFIKKETTSLLFGAVIGAALSNIFDKTIHSVIIDWIPIFRYHFNLADLILIFGSGFLIYYIWKK